MKVLVIRLSSIGDIVLCTPAFRCIKQQINNAEVHFVTKRAYKILTSSNPFIDKFFYLDEDLGEVIQELKKEDYDYIVDLHNNLRSSRIKAALQAQVFTINKLNIEKFILTRLKINLMPGTHFTTRVLDTLKPLGVTDDGMGLDYFIAPEDMLREDDLPVSHVAGYVGIVIGATYYTKKLPVHKLVELCSLLSYPIVLLGGKEDVETGHVIASVDPVKIYNACGKFNLSESADIVRKAHLIISHDTGLQYIACAFQKRIIAVWGGTSPKIGVWPYYGSRFHKGNPAPEHYNFVLNLWCQPCRKYGSNECPLGHFNCMEKQDIPALVKKAHHMLGVDVV